MDEAALSEMTGVDANKRRRKSRHDMSEIILGIDLGTTNSAVGAVHSGFPILLANEDGRRITPIAVWIGRDGSVESGGGARRRR